MAWNTGEACGLTATRSAASRWANQSAVMTETSEALRGLVAADLDAVTGLALVVRRVDDAYGEPQDPALDLLQRGDVHVARPVRRLRVHDPNLDSTTRSRSNLDRVGAGQNGVPIRLRRAS